MDRRLSPLRQVRAGRGFTLVELLTVITILGIILTIGIPSLRDWIDRARVRSAVEDIQNGIRLAQAEAAKANLQVEFSLHANRPAPVGGIFGDGALNPAASASGIFWAVRVLPSNDLVQAGDFGSGSVEISGGGPLIFNGIGRVLTDLTPPPAYLLAPQVYRAQSINNRFPMCVFVQPGGGVRWCDPSITIPGSMLACPAGIAGTCLGLP